MADTFHQVGEVARIASVTVRTLHHYDTIGLLGPSERSEAGYRLYSTDDLMRLQQIQIARSLGLSLEEIRSMLDDPSFDRREALLRQRAELRERAAATASMIAAIDTALALLEDPETLDAAELKELFDGFDHALYEEEVVERWGDTDAYGESKRRTKDYSREQWAAIKAEVETLEARFAEALRAGRAVDALETIELAETHRLHIDRWFYPCSPAMHCSLATMYTRDPRFEAHYEGRCEGLAAYIAAAIESNAIGRP